MTKSTLPERLVPQVLFSTTKTFLYLTPLGTPQRACHRLVELPRDTAAGEDDPNVKLLRAMEKAGMLEMAAQVDAGVRAPRPEVY